MVHDQQIYYADNNGTTQLRIDVKKYISEILENGWANPSATNKAAISAKEIILKSRQAVSSLINCSKDELLFTSGGTESDNMVLWTMSQVFSKPHIIITEVEHDAVTLYAKHLEKMGLLTVTEVKLNTAGTVDPGEILAACTDNTRLVSVMLANNETGVIFPVLEIVHRVHTKYPAVLFHTDAAQAIGKIKVDVDELKVDYLTIVGHKFYGPRIGALYHRKTAPLVPMFYGGGQEGGLRPGTENTPMIAGLGLAAEITEKMLTLESNKLRECRDKLEADLAVMFGSDVIVNCNSVPRLPNTSNLAIMRPNCSTKQVLDKVRFVASKGASCHSHTTSKPSQILLKSGVEYEVALKSIRISFGIHNTLSDIDFIVQDLVRVAGELRDDKGRDDLDICNS